MCGKSSSSNPRLRASFSTALGSRASPRWLLSSRCTRLFGWPSSLVLILAPAERQAKELFSKVATAYQALGHIIPADSYRKMGMELANGSRIEALPGTEKTIRGFSGVDLLLVDEASRVADELYYAVRPMLAVSRGRLMMLTTPYGRRGVFFEEWTSEAGGAWERYEVPASQCPRISEEFLEEERGPYPAGCFGKSTSVHSRRQTTRCSATQMYRRRSHRRSRRSLGRQASG